MLNADDEGMFDTLIANAGRLRILTALVVEPRMEFVQLRLATGLTDGNLSAHARRLARGGLIDIEKHFRDGKPVTTLHLNATGRQRLRDHVEALMSAVTPAQAPQAGVPLSIPAESEWVD